MSDLGIPNPKKPIDWESIAIVLAIITGVLFLLWVVIGGIEATDGQTVEKTDKDCYLIVNEVRNMWLTPGDSYTTRGVYCKEG